MTLAGLSHLPDDARLWLFVLESPMDPSARQGFEAGLTESLGTWQHKGTSYEAAFSLLEDQILVVAEPIMAVNPSGCAIEGLNRKVAKRVAEARATLVPDGPVVIQLSGGLKVVPREALQMAVQAGWLQAETPVLDRTLFNLGDLRRRGLFQPAAATWLGRKFGFSVLVG